MLAIGLGSPPGMHGIMDQMFWTFWQPTAFQAIRPFCTLIWMFVGLNVGQLLQCIDCKIVVTMLDGSVGCFLLRSTPLNHVRQSRETCLWSQAQHLIQSNYVDGFVISRSTDWLGIRVTLFWTSLQTCLFWFDVTFFVWSWDVRDVTFTSVFRQNKVFTVVIWNGLNMFQPNMDKKGPTLWSDPQERFWHAVWRDRLFPVTWRAFSPPWSWKVVVTQSPGKSELATHMFNHFYISGINFRCKSLGRVTSKVENLVFYKHETGVLFAEGLAEKFVVPFKHKVVRSARERATA